MHRSLLLASFLLLAAGSGHAQQLCPRTMAIRINPDGLRLISDSMRDAIPPTFDMPQVSADVVNWPFTQDDARLEIAGVPSALHLHQVSIDMVDGVLTLRVHADVNVDGPATVQHAYGGFGTASCRVTVKLTGAHFRADFKLESQGGQVQVQMLRTDMDTGSGAPVVGLHECAVGSLASDYLGLTTQKGVQLFLERVARQQIPSLLNARLAESGPYQYSGNAQSLAFTTRLDSVKTTPLGLISEIGAGVTGNMAPGTACTDVLMPAPPPSCGQPSPMPVEQSSGMFSASISEGIVNQAAYAAWRSGKLCLNSATLEMPILVEGLDKLAATVGMPTGSQISFDVQLLEPPQIRMNALEGMQLLLKRFKLQLNTTAPGAGTGRAAVVTDLSVSAIPYIDATTNSLAVDLRNVSVTRVEVLGTAGPVPGIEIDPARITRFLADVVLPVLRERLNETTLSPAIVDARQFVVEVQHVYVGDGYLTAQANAYAPQPTGDRIPPETQLVEMPGPVVGPKVLSLRVAGTDNQTLPALLRFKARVDGGQWSEPTYGGRLDVVTHGGVHTIEVAAVDVDNNVDPTPVVLSLTVDDIAPELKITGRPEHLAAEDTIALSFTGNDDRTPASALEFQIDLLRSNDGRGPLDLVQSETVPASLGRVQFSGLDAGVYRARVIVRDAAGNVTSEDVGFVIEDGGCSAAKGSPSSLPTWFGIGLLLLLALPAARRLHSGARR